MSALPTIDDLLSGGAPSLKFTEVKTTHKGVVIKAEATQQTDFATSEPKFWDDGKPMMQLVVTIKTDQRDPAQADDDGERRLFVKGNMLAALRSALKVEGAKSIDPGDTIAVQYTGDGEAKRGMSPPKLYAVQVKKGAGAVGDLLGDDAQPSADAPTDLL